MSRSASLATIGTAALIGAVVLTCLRLDGAGWLMAIGFLAVIGIM